MKKKKRKIRWGRVAILLMVVAAILSSPFLIYNACTGAHDDAGGGNAHKRVAPSKELLRDDSIMTARLDSLMNIPNRLDTANIAISVFDLTTDSTVYSMHDTLLVATASCMKITTALAAIHRLGHDYRYETSLLTRGTMKGDTLRGNLLVKASADPLLESFDPLIKKLRQQGIRHIEGNIYYNLEKDDTLRAHPTAKTWDIPYHKLPMLLKGRRFVVRNFTYTLRANGITYHHNDEVKTKGKYHYVVTYRSKLHDVLSPMLIHSSNIKADAVFYHLNSKAGLNKNNRQDWNGDNYLRHFVGTKLKDYARDGFVINDGSGLSPDNRLTARFLVDMLRYAYDDVTTRDYLINEALASPGIPGRSGSLLTRLSHPNYRNRIFVKTGTLTTIGTSALAGYLKGSDNHWYAFSIVCSDSPVAESRIFQDRVCKMMVAPKAP